MRPLALPLATALLSACAADAGGPGPRVAPGEPAASGLLLTGARAPGGGALSLRLDGPRLRDPADAPEGVPVLDLVGRFVVPGVIDGHTHLAYADRYAGGGVCRTGACTAQEALLEAGVIAAVDLAAPLHDLPDRGPLRVAFSGPMLTAPGGYPTRSWGRDGYGLEVATPEAATAAVDRLADAGARWLKLPLDSAPWLPPEVAGAAVQAAHARGLRVAVHASRVAAVEAAIAIDADLLAHVPSEALPDHVAMAWAPRAVVGTLSSFARGAAAQDNLRLLYEAGARILYGTDLGNGNRPEISAAELAAMRAAGLPPSEILEAATRRPAAYFGFDDLGALAPGRAACVLVYDTDPLEDITALAAPAQVLGEGCRAPSAGATSAP